MTEAELLKRLMLAISSDGPRVFRNNCGQLKDENGRYVRYGVSNPGGSDLIGWARHTITADDVGRTVSIFLAVECKAQRGRLTPEQRNFLEQVRAAGGIAIEAREVEQAIRDINEQRRGISCDPN